MAEKFRFFDPVMDEHGNYDREYNAQEFVEYFSALVTTGVMKGAGNQLTVTADNASMVTTLDTGIAFILGRYYENDAPLQHIHDTETVGKQRIDRIVIRMDNNAGSRYVKSFVKKGIASTAPIPPALTQNDTVYEISVAQVRVVGGQTFIRSENVVDERGTDIICPFAGSRILPNFDNAALTDLIEDVDVLNSKIDLKANIQQENWIEATLINGWKETYSGSNIRFYKDSFGNVHLEGIVNGNDSDAGSTITKLPIGYRPEDSIRFFGAYNFPSEGGVIVYINPDGSIFIQVDPINSIIIRMSFKTEG